MRNKFFKTIFFIFILMICSAILIGAKEYKKSTATVNTFKNVGFISMNETSGYNELKLSVDQKYTKEFVKILNETQYELKSEMASILGEEYKTLTNEYDQINDYIASQIKIFNSSEEYTVLRDKLGTLKEKIDSLDKSSKEEYLDEFRGVLGEISTLNNKFNNQLKEKRDRLCQIKGEVKELFVKNKEELIKARQNSMDSTRKKLAELFSSYNVEIRELNDAFGVKQTKPSYPFDVDSMKECMVAGKLESECFNEILNSENAVFSENTSDILS